MFNRSIFIIIILCSTAVLKTNGQQCNITVQGIVNDEGSGLPLSFVNVYFQENLRGARTKDDGSFSIDSICPGEYHLLLSHIGCEAVKLHIDLTQDTTLNINLSHTSTSIGHVVIKETKKNPNNESSFSLSRKTIEDNANLNLSGLLENESGVHLIKNGSGISKPVVQGLYGNRLMILNNGIPQSGQQWGNDHSPEIDPFSADRIRVIKGVSAIEYGGGNLGNVILIEPKRIQKEPHLHGQVNYAFENNGRGHSLNGRLAKYSPALAWRINSTFKKYGDRKTPDYFLNNTGVQEGNLSLQLEKTINDRLFCKFYASTFNTRLGILRGSQIGNLTDLEIALGSSIPFYTESNFSYGLDAPKQEVGHHLAKLSAQYFIDENQTIEAAIAGQLNNRKEFDIRRSGRTEIASLSLQQFTFNTEFIYSKKLKSDWAFKVGNQNVTTDNTNDPGTGILPLIPDYISFKSGLFTTLGKSTKMGQYNFGLRYDFEQQNVVTISQSIPREIIRYNNTFHNVSALASAKFSTSKTTSISLSSGFAMRNPAINELYSAGLHQGVSGIEEGSSDLLTERALKNTLELNWIPSTKFSINILAYHQYFQNYIFLNPQDEIRLTIRGAFPVFKYEQTNASIYGLDISSQFTLNRSLYGIAKLSLLQGNDISNDIPLVFMPPNSLYASLNYRIDESSKISSNLSLEDTEIEINNRLVLEQRHLLESQDFLPPPSTYSLIGMKLSSNLVFPSYKLRCFLKADNLLNTRYRDYLNRQRYFADAMGRSISVGINFKF